MHDGGLVSAAELARERSREVDGVLPGDGPTRVAFDACCLVGNPTGVANYVQRLLGGMRAAHPDVRFYGYSNAETLLSEAGNLTVRVSVPRRRAPLWHNTQLVDMMGGDDIEVFWGTNGVIPLRPTGAATVVTVHDLVHRFAPETQVATVRWKQRVFQRMSALAANRVVAVSAATAEDMRRYYGRPADAVIHPLVAAHFRPRTSGGAAKIAERELPERFILTVATQEPRKNLRSLIEALHECLRAGVDLPPLVLAGGRGWFEGPLRSFLDPAIAAGRVIDLGYVDNEALAELYARCTMFVLPSIYEGFGLPLLEAQACGAPVLHGSHASMVEAAGGVGVAVEPTVAGLRDALAAFGRGELPLACRLPWAIENDVKAAADAMWKVIVEAWRAKRAFRRADS
jgi:glycosyltransferase involved in cell wall biosynthesis